MRRGFAHAHDDITRILERGRRIAIYGLGAPSISRDYEYDVAEFLHFEGYEILTIGPYPTRVLPVKHFSRLAAAPPVDMAALFPGTPDAKRAVEQARRAEVPILWFQKGARCPELALRAARAGRQVVYNRCLRSEYLARWMPVVSVHVPEMEEIS
jgi:hypothetical protein